MLSCGSCVCISSVGVCMRPAGMCFIWHCSFGVYGCENRGGRYINGLRAEKVHFADINRYNLHFGLFLTYSRHFSGLNSDVRKVTCGTLRPPSFQTTIAIRNLSYIQAISYHFSHQKHYSQLRFANIKYSLSSVITRHNSSELSLSRYQIDDLNDKIMA